MNILVLCTGNSARSILLESLLATRGAGRVSAYSAGSQPTGRVHPGALAKLDEEGHSTHGFHSKRWDEFAASGAPEMEMVITVCGSAAAETCPVWPGAPLRAHWGVEDPAAAAPEAQKAAFDSAFDQLSRRADALLALPLETMERAELQRHLTRIGSLS